MSKNPRVKEALELIERYGGIDGGHHKQWVIDQVARVLTGPDYPAWVKMMKGNVDPDSGDMEYDWDEGIAP